MVNNHRTEDQLISELTGLRRSLVEKERFLIDVFESIQDGISVLDNDMNIAQVNPAMEKWYAYAMPLVGKKCYKAYYGRSKPCDACPAAETMRTGKPACETVPKIGPNGKTAGWLDLYTFPLKDSVTGKANGVIEYARDITKRKKTEGKLKQLVLRDSHTGLYNHRYLGEAIEAELYRAKRYLHPLSVIMLDIDYFKSINDVYGHRFGDLVLKQFASRLKKIVRRSDIIIRFGGEEFIIISPGTLKSTALVMSQRILDAVSLCRFGNSDHTVKLKLSAAVAAYPEDDAHKGMELVDMADQALNKVKEYGGNMVRAFSDLKDVKYPIKNKNLLNVEVKGMMNKIERLTKRANQSLIEAIFAFAKTIELKDHYTGEHGERTVFYATEIARVLNLYRDEIEHVKQAATLHDLGKIGISEKILLKKSHLTKKEFEIIKKHPQIGVDIIRPIQFLYSIIPFIFHHHERWDGKGYPSGLKGSEIPMGARIVALADVYQALISDRPYRKAYSQKKAIEIIKKDSGRHFDPKIVDAFITVLQKNYKKSAASNER